MSKQSNEIHDAAAQQDRDVSRSRRADRNRPNRDAFAAAQEHADTLGLDEKVSDGLRQAMKRFENSPLTLMMEILNDNEQPWERRTDAAMRAFPFLHRKLEDKHAIAPASNGDGTGPGNRPTGPTINLTVSRPSVHVNTREVVAPPAPERKETASAAHAAGERAAERPTTVRRKKPLP